MAVDQRSGAMSFGEKSSRIYAIVVVVFYAVYLAIVLREAQGTPLADVGYVGPMLWTTGGSILANIVATIAVGIAGRDHARDVRDLEIARHGDRVGNAFVIAGAVAALGLAMARADYFWIANAIYLGFVLSAVLGAVTRWFAYRGGFQSW